MHPVIKQVTARIRDRSESIRKNYTSNLENACNAKPQRSGLQCGNLAHGFAACSARDKFDLRGLSKANIAIISAYNDLLSAHQPYETYPQLIKDAIHGAGGVAQFAGGVPAMCDGITQGQPGMELSLMSRDVIAMAASIALAHNLFDGGLMLGICDKIVPGLLMAALRFGHLPFIFVPAGPMPSGISNLEKARIRQRYAEGKADKSELLDAEAASYHSPGTCTFYGTANSNQLLMEIMGLHLPGASFVNPGTPLRTALTRAAAKRIVQLTGLNQEYLPIGKLFSVQTLVNGMVGLLATGGSTNHTMHLVAIAESAGFLINWDDFAELSKVTPLIARVYPNGQADINHFQRAGGMAFLIHTLLDGGLLHEDVHTVMGFGLRHYTKVPTLKEGEIVWREGVHEPLDPDVLTSIAKPFKPEGGLGVLSGNLGRAVIKTSSLPDGRQSIEAPAEVFSSQEEMERAFKSGQLDKDCIVVVRFQGPKACGMPELHKLTPILGVLQDRGYNVGLITDGRMSGASGKIPAAIHVTPEACEGGAIAKIQSGDMILMDWGQGRLELQIAKEILESRKDAGFNRNNPAGYGRELFNGMRSLITSAEQGACSLFINRVCP